jgi:hypothetical protein
VSHVRFPCVGLGQGSTAITAFVEWEFDLIILAGLVMLFLAGPLAIQT